MAARRTLVFVAMVMGALAPFRALLFTRATDPTTETIDLIMCPVYVLGRFLPPTSDFGSCAFFIVVIVANAVLYGFVAHYVLRNVSIVGVWHKRRDGDGELQD